MPFLGSAAVEHGSTTRACLDDFTEVELQLGRHIFGLKRTLVRVAHDGTETVVGTDDDEAFLPYIEGIEAYLVAVGGACVDQLQVVGS